MNTSVGLLDLSKAGASIELRTATTLVVAGILASPGSEKTCCPRVNNNLKAGRDGRTIRTNMSGILNAAPHLRVVVRTRKLVFGPSKRPGAGVEYLRWSAKG